MSASRSSRFNHPEKEPPVPTAYPIGGPQGLSGSFGANKHLLPLQGIEQRFLRRLSGNVVTISTFVPIAPSQNTIRRNTNLPLRLGQVYDSHTKYHLQDKKISLPETQIWDVVIKLTKHHRISCTACLKK